MKCFKTLGYVDSGPFSLNFNGDGTKLGEYVAPPPVMSIVGKVSL